MWGVESPGFYAKREGEIAGHGGTPVTPALGRLRQED